MRRKSIIGFILGIIGGVFTLGLATSLLFATTIVDEVNQVTSSNLTLFTWLMFAGAIVTIVGASLCFNKSRIGGLVMLAGFGLSVPYAVLLFKECDYTSATNITTLVFSCLPLVATLVASISAFFGKKTKQRKIYSKR